MGKKRVITKTGEDSGKTEKLTSVKSKTSVKRIIEKGRIYIKASYNNTVILITDLKGDAIAWS